MIPNRITDSDMIILQSVESYLKGLGTPLNKSPQETIILTQQARDYLYSDIVQRVPRVAAYLLQADMETDTVAQGLNISLSKHVMDPIFVNLLMQYLAKHNNAEENCITGAYLAKILNKWMDQNVKNDKTAKKGEKETATTGDPLEPVSHISWAVNQLLGNIAGLVSTKCANIDEYQALAIAACLAMNNNETIMEIIKSDLPITADVLDIIADPSNLIKSALLLEKADVPAKLSANQTAFMDSLVRWVYKKLNMIPTQSSYQFMVAAYGTITVDVSTKYINPKDCGTQYSNLLTVAKQLINK